MQKTQKQKAIKQLQTELSEEKKAEKTRYVLPVCDCASRRAESVTHQAARDHPRTQKGSGRTAEARGGQGQGVHR